MQLRVDRIRREGDGDEPGGVVERRAGERIRRGQPISEMLNCRAIGLVAGRSGVENRPVEVEHDCSDHRASLLGWRGHYMRPGGLNNIDRASRPGRRLPTRVRIDTDVSGGPLRPPYGGPREALAERAEGPSLARLPRTAVGPTST